MIEQSTPHQPQVIAERLTRTIGSRPRPTESSDRGDWQLVVAFSLVGLLTALNLMFHFPELGALVAQYNQF
jgi:hypothetical protein